MNLKKANGRWRQVLGSVKERWGALNDNEFTRIDGRRERMVGKLQEAYGIAREDAERHVNDWSARV
ncbi:CsbD family protein [Rhodobacteraceae bacterium 2376]|uniref:CsbD family protein n=1 Tax=Rhabdonatronobacter sediminivivens TaxID=2743469 RepID=A0A7Z0I246_9RHOB|nr:CsbD family protein [Rhabdonatronobacter sediminivivens]NYS26550.1 CsbD family protein [Rhabdonatronobacter sediminivivens]